MKRSKSVKVPLPTHLVQSQRQAQGHGPRQDYV